MKIRSIFFEVHPLFQGIKFDFTNQDGFASDTIIIAGGNGVGKSMLLNEIYDFTSLTTATKAENKKVKFELELSEVDILALKEDQVDKLRAGDVCVVYVDYNIIHNWDRFRVSKKEKDGQLKHMSSNTLFGGDNNTIIKSVLSDVEINFSPAQITGVTSMDVDSLKVKNIKSSKSLATEITQLLIDIQNTDALELSEWAKSNLGAPVDGNKIETRTKRFSKAFESIFPIKKFKGVINQDNAKQVVFVESGRDMTIAQLSSGEKQIVFRGGFLLQNIQSLEGGIILIDEPEISLHPEWQLKIMSFFKNLFTNSAGKQSSQLIISTHSPFIIHNANRADDRVIVLKRDSNGKIIIPDEPAFYSWSPETFIRQAFDIGHTYDDNKSIIFVEGETDERYFNRAMILCGKKNLNFEFKWIGRINEKGNAEFSGDSALNQAKTFFQANPKQLKNKSILLYDSDTSKPEETLEKLLIRKMPLNDANHIFKIGVENLLNIPSGFNIGSFYKESRKVDNYGAESIIRELNKSALCSHLCGLSDVDLQPIMQNLCIQIERFNSELKD